MHTRGADVPQGLFPTARIGFFQVRSKLLWVTVKRPTKFRPISKTELPISCAKKMPEPSRSVHFELGLQAIPSLGAKLVLSDCTRRSPMRPSRAIAMAGLKRIGIFS